jgi:hypothetical protein
VRPGGLVLFYGAHPCFNGPHIEDRGAAGLLLHPVYRVPGRHRPHPWWRPGGVRERLGVGHVPLAEMFNAITGAGLRIERVREPRAEAVPFALAILAGAPAP